MHQSPREQGPGRVRAREKKKGPAPRPSRPASRRDFSGRCRSGHEGHVLVFWAGDLSCRSTGTNCRSTAGPLVKFDFVADSALIATACSGRIAFSVRRSLVRDVGDPSRQREESVVGRDAYWTSSCGYLPCRLAKVRSPEGACIHTYPSRRSEGGAGVHRLHHVRGEWRRHSRLPDEA